VGRKLIYKNSLGAEIEIANAAPFKLQKFGTSNSVNLYSSKGLKQNGATYIGNTLDVGDISIQLNLESKTLEDIDKYKNMLNTTFNPFLDEGWLIYNDGVFERKIKCIVNKLPYFSPIIHRRLYTCLISLTANNPFWTDLMENKEEIALWKGDFEFDLEITDDGIEMEHRETSLIVNVLNKGDVECGMRVVFKALASLTNPSILNVNTGEYIKINKAMIAGEVISIVTYFGAKKVESLLNGISTNAFNYIDFQSTFLQLDTGDNLMRYDADTGLDNLEVNIYYMPQYLGV
jgi:hypothetical protein